MTSLRILLVVAALLSLAAGQPSLEDSLSSLNVYLLQVGAEVAAGHGARMAAEERKVLAGERTSVRQIAFLEGQADQAPSPQQWASDEQAAEEAVIASAAGDLDPMNPNATAIGTPTAAEQKAYVDEGSLTNTMASFVAGVVVGIVLTLTAFHTAGGHNDEDESPAPEVMSGGSGPRSQSQVSVPPPSIYRGKSATENVESIHLFWPRVTVLIVLMLFSSISTFILESFSNLEAVQPAILLFLTMTVGTGGNVGSQSVVMAVRSLALGEEVQIWKELGNGFKLGGALGAMALVRCLVTGAGVQGSFIIASAVAFVVIAAAFFGTFLPLLFYYAKIDPAHATAAIQVLMDMTGTMITCVTGLLYVWLWNRFNW